MKYYKSLKIKNGKFAGRVIHLSAGNSTPYGVSHIPGGINFSLFSKSAEYVYLSIFDVEKKGLAVEIPLSPKINKTGDVWHIAIANLPKTFLYAYKIDGPYNPQEGHYFMSDKLLIDPYAKSLAGGEIWGKCMLKGDSCAFRYSMFPVSDFDWEGDRPLNIPLKDTIIYELHVRGYTIHETSGVEKKGTFYGIVEKIPYLKELGITSVELMPINEFDENECMFTNPVTGERLKNYWGYSTINFFSPKASYASSALNFGQIDEFKYMVRELHKAGIEVILDIVFNHTAEGNENGPTISFRGIENKVYYMLDSENKYMNFSGCGNTLNCNHPVVRELILDCLRYWVTEMHIDGFRFDLASILGRDQNGNVLSNPPVLEAIALDPILSKTKIIAEAWDAAGLYQVGHFPAWQKWAEWNDRFRDSIRAFVKGDMGLAGEVATRIAGSSDMYGDSGRKPYHSVNFVTSHDGFTLADLVSYNEKHNYENGENNRDGHSNNISWNCGVEGPTDKVSVLKLRIRQMKNFFAILLISQGTPMFVAGDEFARTQKGNNNAYCQDNEISWVNWDFKEKNNGLFRFVRELINFRKKHHQLRRETFFTGQAVDPRGLPDISWHGTKLNKPDFSPSSKRLAFMISGDTDIYVAINPSYRRAKFELPLLQNKDWYVKADTYNNPPDDIYYDGDEPLVENLKFYTVMPRSLIILISK